MYLSQIRTKTSCLFKPNLTSSPHWPIFNFLSYIAEYICLKLINVFVSNWDKNLLFVQGKSHLISSLTTWLNAHNSTCKLKNNIVIEQNLLTLDMIDGCGFYSFLTICFKYDLDRYIYARPNVSWNIPLRVQ